MIKTEYANQEATEDFIEQVNALKSVDLRLSAVIIGKLLGRSSSYINNVLHQKRPLALEVFNRWQSTIHPKLLRRVRNYELLTKQQMLDFVIEQIDTKPEARQLIKTKLGVTNPSIRRRLNNRSMSFILDCYDVLINLPPYSAITPKPVNNPYQKMQLDTYREIMKLIELGVVLKPLSNMIYGYDQLMQRIKSNPNLSVHRQTQELIRQKLPLLKQVTNYITRWKEFFPSERVNVEKFCRDWSTTPQEMNAWLNEHYGLKSYLLSRSTQPLITISRSRALVILALMQFGKENA